MHRDHGENAPRGTWNDDSASEQGGESRRSVSGPYRDPMDAARARRAALKREIDDLDERLARREQAGRELLAIDREVHAVARPRAATVALRSIVRGVVGLAPGFLCGALVVGGVDWAPRPVAVVAHDTPSVVRLDGQRFVVARSALDRLVATTAEGARVEPYVEKDTIIGLRLGGLAPGSELRDLGLADGDIIVAVDDHDIARPNGARDAYRTLLTAWRFELVVRRGDRLRRLSYEVVG